jgi:hypothetical protein
MILLKVRGTFGCIKNQREIIFTNDLFPYMCRIMSGKIIPMHTFNMRHELDDKQF